MGPLHERQENRVGVLGADGADLTAGGVVVDADGAVLTAGGVLDADGADLIAEGVLGANGGLLDVCPPAWNQSNKTF